MAGRLRRLGADAEIQEKFLRTSLPAVWVSAAVADKVLGKRGRTLDALKTARDGGEPGRSFATGTKVRLEVNGRFLPRAQGNDGLAGFSGTDPDLRREIVLVGAHLDHLGVDALGRVFQTSAVQRLANRAHLVIHHR